MQEIWPTARFLSRGERKTFLEHVRLWNSLEDMPSINAEPLGDGLGVRLQFGEARVLGVVRLIEACGGRIVSGVIPDTAA
jgi:hypothetical protein